MTFFTKRIMKLLRFAAFSVAFISLTLCIFRASNCDSVYQLIFLWPLFFLVFLLVNYRKGAKIKQNHYLTLSLIIFTQMIPRYVIYPALILLSSNKYIGIRHISLSSSDINLGILIVVAELLCFTFFVFAFEHLKKDKKVRNESICFGCDKTISGNKFIYAFFILLAILLYAFIGYRMNIVQFITIDTGYSKVSENSLYMLVKYVISIGIAMIVLLVFSKEKQMYKLNHNNIHFLIALFAGLLLTMVIVGESRGTQITIGIVVVLILVEDYPNKRVFIFSSILAAIAIVVVSITIFRTGSFNTLFGSSIDYLARQFQIYYGGPDSVIQNIRVFESIDTNLFNLVFDFVRSCFPFNLVLKNYGDTISQIYNLTLYNGMFSSRHIVFSAGYGYIFFGIIGIPLTICLNYFLSCKACEVFTLTRSYEVKYVAGYCMLKLVNVLFENTPAILGSVTQYIGTFGLLIFVANRIRSQSIRFSEERTLWKK